MSGAERAGAAPQENPGATTPSHVEPLSQAVVYYAAAKRSLEQAARVDEVKAVADEAERMKLYARQAKDRTLIADAVEIQTRAHRRLGEMLRAAKEAGQLSQGGRPRKDAVETPADREGVLARVTLKEAGIDYKLSSKAQQLADVEPNAFERLLARSRERIVSEGAIVIDPVRDAKQANKREHRDERAAQLAAKHRALPQVKAGIILADPAWRDEEVWSAESGMDRAADNHYPTMTLAEVMALKVGEIAADDAILFLWAKTNNLPAAFCVAAAWGFFAIQYEESTGWFLPDTARCRYASAIGWDKEVIGNGRWVRDQLEILLIFRRGNPVAPAPGTQLASVQRARKTEHSAKPESILEWIDRCWPDEVKIELNRRGAPRPGWVAWGNEVEDAAPAGEAFRSTEATDAAIRRHYAAEVVDFDALCAEIGATRLQARRRANQLGLGKRARQLGAVLALRRDGGRFTKQEATT